ncbi:nucleoside/nucleotide kinase family protein [Plantactinospora sp. KLBMP9567]|uniref:nucleoside/nucleotide kinase family protein n=1 Tax=Plantactinospora sp. KLBMP9567 TaxID=3085900 RepID=UPI0029812CD7|nr:nucleoside/nucleotide kinase family protein [Plantactinospora sp. KLBMP9567]MDW5326249.1 nucleoside/nucleotide kinase family protein [Plantactinospora sp. KLBMP9567]MDW5330827.1 nucleoside/nucleotide kinase family protein [Plantactinospora sp. KLBMP9567]
MRTEPFRHTLDQLVARARVLASTGPRRLLGITGAPAAGKSTLAGLLVTALDGIAELVPMDGFHLAEAELHRLGRHARKGAPDTFDGGGFVALLRRLRAGTETVYAPEFRRELEEPVAGAIPVPPSVPLVVVEGNYLLVPDQPWGEVRGLLDEAWFLDLDETERLHRLTERHIAFGREPLEAAARARGTDQRNAELVAGTVDRADLVVRMAPSNPA